MRLKALGLALHIIGFLLLVSSIPFSQAGSVTGRIKGTVKDNEGNPLKDGKIIAAFENQYNFEAKTDDNGRWAIAGVGTGLFRITATKKEYQSVIIEINVSQFKNKTIDFTLNKIVPLPGKVELMKVFEQGIELYEEELYEEALTKFQEFFLANPNMARIRVNIANCYRQLGRNSKALEEYQAILD